MGPVPLHWDNFRFALALKRGESLGGAAKILACEPTAVSDGLTALETELGVALVIRAPDGFALNDAGKRAAEIAETFDRGVEELTRLARDAGSEPEGVVKLASTDGTAMFLMGGLAPLRKQYPKLTVELLVANITHDLLRGEADLALRMFRDPNPELISEKVGDLGWSVFASRVYLARAPFKTDVPLVESIVGHPMLGFAAETARSPGGRWVTANARPQDITKRTGNMTSVINGAKNGLGLAVLPSLMVRDVPELVRVTPEVVANSEAFIVLPRTQEHNKRLRLVIDVVATLFASEAG